MIECSSLRAEGCRRSQCGSVPLALAAYNTGPAPVAARRWVPPYQETRGYVARILGLLGGASAAVAGGRLEVRPVQRPRRATD
jgi:hypothetical protein